MKSVKSFKGRHISALVFNFVHINNNSVRVRAFFKYSKKIFKKALVRVAFQGVGLRESMCKFGYSVAVKLRSAVLKR